MRAIPLASADAQVVAVARRQAAPPPATGRTRTHLTTATRPAHGARRQALPSIT